MTGPIPHTGAQKSSSGDLPPQNLTHFWAITQYLHNQIYVQTLSFTYKITAQRTIFQ